jgi:hypothetical protein
MARAALAVTDVTSDEFATPAFVAFNNTDGMYIANFGKGTLILDFKNTNAAARDVTIKAGVGGDVGSAWRASAGDLLVEVPATTGNRRVVIRDSARFAQANGQLYIDAEGADVTVSAIRVRG